MHNRSDTQHMEKEISKATLKRLPTYLSYLKALPSEASANISATALAAGLHMGEVQVRKDLALVSDGGRPKIGYNREHLIADIENFLGYGNSNDAVLIGAGKLGRALLGYGGFAEYGLNIVAAFDANDTLIGTTNGGKPIMHLSRLGEVCQRYKIKIGIITVPAGVCAGRVRSADRKRHSCHLELCTQASERTGRYSGAEREHGSVAGAAL